MTERVFLSEKKIVFAEVLQGRTPDEVAFNLANLFDAPFVVKTSQNEKEEQAKVGHTVTSYGCMKLQDGTRAYVLSVAVLGTEAHGMFFFREGTNYLTEMVNPERKKVHQVISGEKI